MTTRRITRAIKVGSSVVGGNAPILIQTMTAVKTRDVDAVVSSITQLAKAGAGLVRVAVDSQEDAAALAEIRKRVDANLSVDLQENFKLAEKVAPYVDKIRYNPGKLFRLEPEKPWQKKVEYLVKVALDNDCALRVGVNCGSLDPAIVARFQEDADAPNPADPLIASALEHVDFLETIGFQRYCVSIKDSDPKTVVLANKRFAELRPDVPLHLGVTEAGLPPRGILKTRVALEPLLAEGIGETLRVSLTVPADQKTEEIEAGRLILANVASGEIATPSLLDDDALNIVSCPSCSRVENSRFVELVKKVEEATAYARGYPFTIAVMGCRVNGPGETDGADIGLWCGGERVNLKSGATLIGSFGYDEIIDKTLELLNAKIKIYNASQIDLNRMGPDGLLA